MTLPRLLATGVLAALLGGCAGTVFHTYHAGYTPSMLSYAAARQPVTTLVIGNPFAAPQGELDAAVTDAMFASHFGPRVRFSTSEPGGGSPYHVVVLFDPAPNLDQNHACTAPERDPAADGAKIRVLMAFCAGDSRESSVLGSLEGASGPGDPALARLIGQMTSLLLPARSPDPNGGGSDFKG